jgi:hypothetical protein
MLSQQHSSIPQSIVNNPSKQQVTLRTLITLPKSMHPDNTGAARLRRAAGPRIPFFLQVVPVH